VIQRWIISPVLALCDTSANGGTILPRACPNSPNQIDEFRNILVGVYVRAARHPGGGAVGDVWAGLGAAQPREPGPGGLHPGAAEAEDQRGQHSQPAPAPPTHAGDKLS